MLYEIITSIVKPNMQRLCWKPRSSGPNAQQYIVHRQTPTSTHWRRIGDRLTAHYIVFVHRSSL